MDFYPLYALSNAGQLLLKHRNIKLSVSTCMTLHPLYHPHQPQLWHCTLKESKQTNEVKPFCLKPSIISFHKILLFRVFLHEILLNKRTIFSITTNGKITSPVTASVCYTNLFLEQWFCILLCISSIKLHIRAPFWLLFPSEFISTYMDLFSRTRSSMYKTILHIFIYKPAYVSLVIAGNLIFIQNSLFFHSAIKPASE